MIRSSSLCKFHSDVIQSKYAMEPAGINRNLMDLGGALRKHSIIYSLELLYDKKQNMDAQTWITVYGGNLGIKDK